MNASEFIPSRALMLGHRHSRAGALRRRAGDVRGAALARRSRHGDAVARRAVDVVAARLEQRALRAGRRRRRAAHRATRGATVGASFCAVGGRVRTLQPTASETKRYSKRTSNSKNRSSTMRTVGAAHAPPAHTRDRQSSSHRQTLPVAHRPARPLRSQ